MLKKKIKEICRKYKILIIFLVCSVIFTLISLILHWNKNFTIIQLILFGLITKGLAQLLTLIGLIPFLGPLLVKIISWPLFLILNSIASLVTFTALKSGHKKEVINTKILVTIFLLGIIIGIILGKLL